MKKIKIVFCLLTTILAACGPQTEQAKEVDICIYGGTSAGVIAAYTASQAGKSVLLIEPGRHLGGMTSGGLGYTDIGNKYVIRGLALDFYRRLGTHYGKLEQWIFEPKEAEAVFNEYVKKAGIEVWYDTRITEADVDKGMIRDITLENSVSPQTSPRKTVRAKVFIDCSYEGDLMACSGVSYTVGREANAQYGETYNGAQRMDGHQFPDGIDPYVVKGDSTSGLLYGINPDPIVPDGEENKKVQAYNFRITLTNRPENRVEITKPDNYDPQRYELLIRLKEKQPWKAPYDVFIWSRMPNGKTDINNFGGFSTDVIGENWNYPEAGYEERDSIRKFHEDYTKGLLYFVGHDPRIPDSIRQEMLQWGYPKDEYTDNGHWTHQMYVREARRMIGATVMTQHHCEGRETATDGIAWAAYTMDSHNCDRHVVNGMVKNEGNVEIGGFGPYPISYRAITPRAEEVGNLLVPVCLSASHIAYGSIRMEPVFMVLGQVSAIGACQAIDGYGNRIQKVGAEAINDEFTKNPLADGSQPELFIDNNDTENVAVCGTWKTETNVWSAYGPDFLSDDSKGASPKSLKYMPQIPVETEYDIYAYFPKVNNLTTRTLINVCNGKQQHERVIESADIVVEGQTGGEWVSIGRYKLPEGRESYVEISNKGADGIVVADAVLFIPARP